MFHPFRTLSYGANNKGSVWLTLDCDADASLGRVISAAQMAVDAWRENKKEEDAPIATGDVARALRKAKAELEERGISGIRSVGRIQLVDKALTTIWELGPR